VRDLSGGNQQKVIFSKWLQADCRVLLVDEPTRGVDVGAKREIYQLLRQLTQRGVAIVMVSSELPEILGMSDRILVMREGRIAAEVPRASATEERIMAHCTRVAV
jgi:ribose transport system ATP-binding protein